MKEFNKKIQEQFKRMLLSGKLFRVALSGQDIWDLYLKSFNDDPIFRDPSSSVHNCNHCKNFLRRYGNVVSINEVNQIETIFDIVTTDEFQPVALALTNAIQASKITEVFFETFAELNALPYESCNKTNTQFQLGVASNPKRYTTEEAEKYGVVKADEIRVFDHMHLHLPSAFVDMSGKSVEALMGEYRDAKNVFQRAMETISLDTLKLVKDLINQGSLLDGPSHLHKIDQFIPLKTAYDALSSKERDNWCWNRSYRLPIAKFRNELIGVLCSELSEGEELNKAVQSWNKRVDPANYMKVSAPITQRHIDEAKAFVEDNGYTESFDRRFANIDDIKTSEILHTNVGDSKISSVSIFDSVKANNTQHKRNEFIGVESIPIDKFMSDILPQCTAIEVFLTNSHESNMVSLTTANVKESKPLFKWSNNYSWTYNGNLAGKSLIKQAVKDAGGNVEGVLNFRLAWNDAGLNDGSDLDAWATEANGDRIGFNTDFRRDRGNKRTRMSGQLDVDNMNPNGKMAVENITWIDKSKMIDGVYRLWVHQYRTHNSRGFKVEIEFDGTSYTYTYDQPVSGSVNVAEVTLANNQFTIKHLLPESGVTQKDVYGLKTNQFHKVNLMCLSPNHWGENQYGNKHYFFMLDGCLAPAAIRSFHNENLLPELVEHRRVLEVLGSMNLIDSTPKQLSGLGFNATIPEELIVRLHGSHKRVVKLTF